VVAGKDCASQYLFTDSSGNVGDCITGNAAFTYIGVGNGSINTIGGGTTGIGPLNATLADSLTGDADTTATCSATAAGPGSTDGGDMARRNVVPTFVTSGTDTIVTLDTSGVGSDGPFTFDANNATDVTDSGLFNGDYTLGPDLSTHTCTAAEGDSDAANVDGGWNMFSRQLLNNESGITVTDGDSLSVKWTITVG